MRRKKKAKPTRTLRPKKKKKWIRRKDRDTIKKSSDASKKKATKEETSHSRITQSSIEQVSYKLTSKYSRSAVQKRRGRHEKHNKLNINDEESQSNSDMWAGKNNATKRRDTSSGSEVRLKPTGIHQARKTQNKAPAIHSGQHIHPSTDVHLVKSCIGASVRLQDSGKENQASQSTSESFESRQEPLFHRPTQETNFSTSNSVRDRYAVTISICLQKSC